ncbi:hypothetical protein ADUPG1_013977 [Aduncisulcus paluster]|uniref:Uncharacterized protein n=1 Tax=Aduncisulcus paluster TaxID=2918883 RepID=A0ABQ5K525_9EUKA|nr:hypothetical protein ADUPG1_013977 [Aduncisulcus paluster]
MPTKPGKQPQKGSKSSEMDQLYSQLKGIKTAMKRLEKLESESPDILEDDIGSSTSKSKSSTVDTSDIDKLLHELRTTTHSGKQYKKLTPLSMILLSIFAVVALILSWQIYQRHLPHYIPYIPPLTTTFCLSLSSFTIRRFFLSNEASFFVFPTFSATARSQEPITLTVFSVAMTLTAVGVLLTGLYYKRMMDAKYFGKSGNNDNLKQDRFRQRPWSKSARVRTIQRQLTIEDESFKTPLGQRKSRLRIGYNHRSKQRSKPWWSIAFRQRPWSKSARVRTIQRQLTIEDESFKTPLGQRKSRLRIGYNHRSKQRSKPWWSIALSP